MVGIIYKYRLSGLFLIAILFSINTKAQSLNDFGFDYWKSLEVISSAGKLDNPWVGGLNNIQMGKLDLNNDGVDDLILFERHGNKLLPFIYNSTGNPHYEYAPEFRAFFPSLEYLFQLHDYNGDGRPDIFTYTTGGLMVYKNTSDGFLSFVKAVNPFIKSKQGNIFTNLLVTNVDYPAIDDIDGDGDLDILTFWGLGSFMELHKNMSVETYGNSDSLLYHKTDYCWGRFSEDIESNKIILDTCVNFANRDADRHTGSTLLLLDVNQDETLDLILGDVDFSNVLALVNDGDNLNAIMTEQIDSFPLTYPINLPTFPVLQNIDIYNDGLQNLVASPFDPSLTKSAGYNSVWLYEVGDSGNHNLVNKSFLQDEMLDLGLGAYPVLRDVTEDGLVDLVISNYGHLDTIYYNQNGQLQTKYISSISLLINSGTLNQPRYTVAEDDLANISSLELTSVYPTFADIDGDDDLDLLIGSSDNNLRLFTNTSLLDEIPIYGQPEVLQVATLGTFLTPTLVDIDEDGKIDLVVGNREGKLSYYKNFGTLLNPSFELVTHNFGNVNVTDVLHSYTGYSVPCFFRKDNKLRLLVGSESGKIFYYPTVALGTDAIFNAEDDIFDDLYEGIRSSTSVADIDNDGYTDMAIGNYGGGIVMMRGTEGGPTAIIEKDPLMKISLRLYPNPTNNFVTIKMPTRANWEISIYDSYGRLNCRYPASYFSEIDVDIKQLRSGLYLIVASPDNKNLYEIKSKLIITR